MKFSSLVVHAALLLTALFPVGAAHAVPPGPPKIPPRHQIDAANELKRHLTEKGLFCLIRSARTEEARVKVYHPGTIHETTFIAPPAHNCVRFRVEKVEGSKIIGLRTEEVFVSVATGEHEVNSDRTWLVDMELAKAKIGEPIKWTTGEQWGGGFDDYLLHVEPKGGVFLREVAGRVVNKHFPNNKDGSLRDYQVWGFESKGDALYARYLLRMLAEPKFITNASAQRTAELGLVETALFDHSQDGLCKDFFDVMSWLEIPQSVYDTAVANIPGKFSPADMLKESLLKYLEVTGHRLHPVAEIAFTLEELVSGIIRGERFEPIKYQGVTFIGANLSAGLYDKVSRKELLQYIWAIRQSRVEKGPDMWMGITDPLLPRVNGNVRGYCGLVREAALGPIGSGI